MWWCSRGRGVGAMCVGVGLAPRRSTLSSLRPHPRISRCGKWGGACAWHPSGSLYRPVLGPSRGCRIAEDRSWLISTHSGKGGRSGSDGAALASRTSVSSRQSCFRLAGQLPKRVGAIVLATLFLGTHRSAMAMATLVEMSGLARCRWRCCLSPSLEFCRCGWYEGEPPVYAPSGR